MHSPLVMLRGNLLTIPCQVGLASEQASAEEDRRAVSSQVGIVWPGLASRPPPHLPCLTLGPRRRGRRRGEHAGGMLQKAIRLEEGGARNIGLGQGWGW